LPQSLAEIGGGLREVLRNLIEEDLVGLICGDVEINPHIIRLGFEPKEAQIKKLASDKFYESCIYPRPKRLEVVVDRSQYDGEPYKLCLALGEP